MLKTISQWVHWTNTSIREEWSTWEEWQRNQPLSHFEQSEIFQYYLSQRPRFKPPKYSCITDSNSRYYIYCFGDFASLLVNPHGGDAMDYFALLLDIYDTCKGTTRRITGDPTGISLLRSAVQKRSLNPIQNHNFSQYNYDYNTLHAHTVAEYSLSTLMLRFVSHYMSCITTRPNYSLILYPICQKAYNKSVFGEPKQIKSDPISIPNKISDDDGKASSSWPRVNNNCLRCKSCNRVTENLWGNFDACIDCHLKRICSTCGIQAVIIGPDSLPKCYYHRDSSQQ